MTKHPPHPRQAVICTNFTKFAGGKFEGGGLVEGEGNDTAPVIVTCGTT